MSSSRCLRRDLKHSSLSSRLDRPLEETGQFTRRVGFKAMKWLAFWGVTKTWGCRAELMSQLTSTAHNTPEGLPFRGGGSWSDLHKETPGTSPTVPPASSAGQSHRRGRQPPQAGTDRAHGRHDQGPRSEADVRTSTSQVRERTCLCPNSLSPDFWHSGPDCESRKNTWRVTNACWRSTAVSGRELGGVTRGRRVSRGHWVSTRQELQAHSVWSAPMVSRFLAFLHGDF